MQLTTEEQERTAYAAGDTALATAWGRVIDLEQECITLRDTLIDAQTTLEHLKRILADALVDDCWRARATAALE
jgi:hypothetical protein